MHSCDNGLSVCQRVARMVKFVEMYVNVVFVKLFVHFGEFSSIWRTALYKNYLLLLFIAPQLRIISPGDMRISFFMFQILPHPAAR